MKYQEQRKIFIRNKNNEKNTKICTYTDAKQKKITIKNKKIIIKRNRLLPITPCIENKNENLLGENNKN